MTLSFRHNGVLKSLVNNDLTSTNMTARSQLLSESVTSCKNEIQKKKLHLIQCFNKSENIQMTRNTRPIDCSVINYLLQDRIEMTIFNRKYLEINCTNLFFSFRVFLDQSVGPTLLSKIRPLQC